MCCFFGTRSGTQSSGYCLWLTAEYSSMRRIGEKRDVCKESCTSYAGIRELLEIESEQVQEMQREALQGNLFERISLGGRTQD